MKFKSVLLLLFMSACSDQTAQQASLNNVTFNFSDIDVVVQKDTDNSIDADSFLNSDEKDSLEEDSITFEDVPDDQLAVEEDVTSQPQCVDEDGDNYGQDCDLGPDCDDLNPNFNVSCPDCSVPGTPGCICKSGSKSLTCYSGDPAWLGKGLCAKGTHQCSGGFWSECKGDILPAPEVCDGKDNDCDGQIDDGVKSSCGNCDLSCEKKEVGAKTATPFELNSENSTGVGLDTGGNIVIDMTKISLNLKFIWIANSPNNTVSKVDCKTIAEVGRYSVCSDPSRTSVDLEGNVWVACRGDGQVAKIIADKKNCVDKNGNGIIETSTNNQVVGNDECVKFIVQPNKGSYARGAAVDKENNVWVGYWYTKALVRLNQNSGATMSDINIGCEPYGLVIDQKGTIWAQGAGCGSLIMVDPATGVVTKSGQLPSLKYPAGAYGLTVDKYGRIWVASGNSASVYDPKTLQWKVVNMQWGGGRGVASSNDGYVYVAVDGSGGAVKINGNIDPPQVEGFMKGAGNPVGVALDYDGFVWVVNQGGSSTTKLDPKTMTAIGTTSVGSSPYTYSDMTGYTLNFFTAPKGLYTTVFFATGSGNPITQPKTKAVWQSLVLKGQFPAFTHIDVQVRSADTAIILGQTKWTILGKVDANTTMPIDLTVTGQSLLGSMLQVQVNLVTEDKKVSPSLESISAKAKLL